MMLKKYEIQENLDDDLLLIIKGRVLSPIETSEKLKEAFIRLLKPFQLLNESIVIAEDFDDFKPKLQEAYEAALIMNQLDLQNEFKNFEDLYATVREYCFMEAKKGYAVSEFRLQDLFVSELKNLIPGAVIVDPPFKDRKNIPDDFVSIGGKIRPVEVKRHYINTSAIHQILRYIRIYKADIGYVVAPKLELELPNNVRFIKLTTQEEG